MKLRNIFFHNKLFSGLFFSDGTESIFHICVFRALYNTQLSDKYAKLLKEIFCNYANMILGLEYQYMGNFHNNATQIYSASMHFGLVDMNTFDIWPCQIMFHIYDSHAASHSLYMSQIVDYPYNQTFCFYHFDLYL